MINMCGAGINNVQAMRSWSMIVFEPKTIKVDSSCGVKELPRDFMVAQCGSRWRRYENYGVGWKEYIWNNEWVWSDDVGEQTVIDAWLGSEQTAVLLRSAQKEEQ